MNPLATAASTQSAYELENLVKTYLNQETIEDYNIGNNQKTTVERTKNFDTLGQNIVFYGSNINIINNQKVPYTLKLNKKLDFAPYVSANYAQPTQYELFGTVLHGGGTGGGHYIAIVKDRINNMWYFYNDSHRIKLSDDNALKILTEHGSYGNFTFVLSFYRQKLP